MGQRKKKGSSGISGELPPMLKFVKDWRGRPAVTEPASVSLYGFE
jgi:hypothetical protein